MDTATVALPIRSGATEEYEIALDADDNLLAFDTIVGARLDFRISLARSRPPVLSLRTGAAPTAGGSSLTIVSQTPARIVFRVRLGAADTGNVLPWYPPLGSDLEMDYPSGDRKRPLRFDWMPDGEWTHDGGIA